MEELVSTASLPKTILALAGVDVGDAMIGENLLDVEIITVLSYRSFSFSLATSRPRFSSRLAH